MSLLWVFSGRVSSHRVRDLCLLDSYYWLKERTEANYSGLCVSLDQECDSMGVTGCTTIVNAFIGYCVYCFEQGVYLGSL